MADPEPVRILDKLTEHSDFHTAIFLTYGADLAFFEEAVLYPLWLNGCRNVLVFMDAERYADTLRDLRASVTWVGRRYIVIPVDLGPHRSFHPKLVLLLGNERGRLLIGSGNLTFNGFGHNWEIFTCLDWTPEESALQHLFVESWRMVGQILEKWGHSAEARRMLRKAESVAPWFLSDGGEATNIQLFHTLDQPLIGQCTSALAGETIERLTVLSPFLDDAARALSELDSRFHPSEIRLVLQDHRTVGQIEALKNLIGKGIPLAVHRLTDDERYLHAKIYIFETREKAYAFTGSGNCTRSGLLSTSTEGNMEVMLLHRGGSRQHYAPLVDSHISPRPIGSLEEITIVEQPLSPPAADSTGIRLLDVSVTGGLLSVAFALAPSVEGTTSLQLRLWTTPPRFLPLGEYAAGETRTFQSAVPQEFQEALTRPVSARVEGRDHDGARSQLSSNELWVTNVDVLRREVVWMSPDNERAAKGLAEMVLSSDDEWRDLYDCLIRLIELDVAGLKRRGGSYTSSPPRHRATSLDQGTSHGITVTLVDDEPDAPDTDDLATDLFRESPLYAWLEHVSGRLPSPSPTPQTSDAERPDPLPPGEDESTVTKQRREPSERTGRRFVNLLKKYISSLRNVDYMETASIYHILHYYATFQRIAWLLLLHHVIDHQHFVQLVTDMNRGFFGGPEQHAPALCPTLRTHMQRRWSNEWRAAETPFYALASVALCRALVQKCGNDTLRSEVVGQSVRTLAGVTIVMHLSSLMTDDAQALVRVGEAYSQDPHAFAAEVVDAISAHLPSINKTVGEWARATTIAMGEVQDVRLREALRRARVDYAMAWYDILGLDGDGQAQASLCSNLVFWARCAGDSDEATKWGEILVDLLQQQGKGHEAAKAMYHRGTLLFVDQEYEEAANVLRQGALLAKRLGDNELRARCEQFLRHTDFFLQQS